MELERSVRVLWVVKSGSAEEFPAGPYAVQQLPAVDVALAAVEAAQTSGSPHAVCFLEWSRDAFGPRALNDLLRINPDLFVVCEGAAASLPCPSELGPWVTADRCITLARPVPPVVRRSLAEHLGARWLQETREHKRVASLEAEARRNRTRRRQFEQRLQVLYGIVEKLHSTEGLVDALGVALGEMTRFLGARTASLLLLQGGERLKVLEAVGPNRGCIVGQEVALADSRIARHALERREPVLVADMNEDQRFQESAETRRYRASSVLSVPLFAQGSPLGVINFGGNPGDGAFTEHDRDLVVTLARQLAVAIEKARLVDGLRAAMEQSIQALAEAIERKDTYTRGHSRWVTIYTLRIAEAMGIPVEQMEILERAAILHDVGKIGVPEQVLNKPTRLTAEEFGLVKRHPEWGVRIVDKIGGMESTIPIIRAHHERFDGSGYPDGLHGKQIPLGARIMFVADTYDAMTRNRPYRKGLPREVALEEIRRCAGTQFDPEVAAVFLERAAQWPLEAESQACEPAPDQTVESAGDALPVWISATG